MASENEDWLNLNPEKALEPDLPICDPHHHLWDFRTDYVDYRYLLDDLLADISGGHNIVSTVFIECRAMYRADESDPLRMVGETEFVNGIAAMSARRGNTGRSGSPPASSAAPIWRSAMPSAISSRPTSSPDAGVSGAFATRYRGTSTTTSGMPIRSRRRVSSPTPSSARDSPAWPG